MANFFNSPENPPVGQPPQTLSATETISLHTLMEIKESIGEIKSDIKALRIENKTTNDKVACLDSDIKTVCSDVIDIKSKISFINGAKWAIVSIIALAIAGATFYLTSLFYLKKIEEIDNNKSIIQQPSMTELKN